MTLATTSDVRTTFDATKTDVEDSWSPMVKKACVFTVNGQAYYGISTTGTAQVRLVPLTSAEALRHIANAVDATNATVNYATACEPYMPQLQAKAEKQTLYYDKQFIACGDFTLELVTLPDGSMGFQQVTKLPPIMPLMGVPLVGHTRDSVYQAVRSPPLSRLGAPFSHVEDFEAFLWNIGNSIVEECTNPRMVVLLGSGSNGKSVLIQTVTKALGAEVTSQIKDSDMRVSYRQPMPPQLTRSLVGKRIATCGDIVLSGESDIHSLKLILGSDTIPLDSLPVRPQATVLAATNTAPCPTEVPEFASLPLARRLLILHCGTEFRPGEDAPPAPGLKLYGALVSAAVAMRFYHKVMPPISCKSLLYSLMGSEAPMLLEYLTDGESTASEQLAVTTLMAMVMQRCPRTLLTCISHMAPQMISADLPRRVTGIVVKSGYTVSQIVRIV